MIEQAPVDLEADAPSASPEPDKPKRTRSDRKPPRGGQRATTSVVDLLKQHGGRIEGGQRGIAKSLGLSKSRTNEVLNSLAALGTLKLATGRAGTTVELATA